MPKKIQKRVLVVEDDKAYANIYRVKLQNEGFDIIMAMNGDEALMLAAAEIPDLILLDLIMPVTDGFQVLETIKSQQKLKKIPIVVFSNLSQEEDIERVKKMGAAEYFIKANLSIHEMVSKVRAYLS